MEKNDFIEMELLLSVTDVQKKLGIAHRAAYELFHRKGFPVIRFSRKMYVREKSLMKYLEKLEIKA